MFIQRLGVDRPSNDFLTTHLTNQPHNSLSLTYTAAVDNKRKSHIFLAVVLPDQRVGTSEQRNTIHESRGSPVVIHAS